MKKKLIKWLERHGFVGDACSVYRFSKRGNNHLSVERRRRFRWEELRLLTTGFVWRPRMRRGLTILATFPDLGQAKDGLLVANLRAENERILNTIVKRWILDTDNPIYAKDEPQKEDRPLDTGETQDRDPAKDS